MREEQNKKNKTKNGDNKTQEEMPKRHVRSSAIVFFRVCVGSGYTVVVCSLCTFLVLIVFLFCCSSCRLTTFVFV